ncbi:MAG: hypothetical protein Q8P56_02245 [Candidatus Uhrbacteria bacterium]|nr:hypothetical protein [Candidatus Uhrbacteria bacterium]
MRSDLGGKIEVTLDGTKVASGVVELRDDGETHEVIVAFGKITALLP